MQRRVVEMVLFRICVQGVRRDIGVLLYISHSFKPQF